MCLCAFVPLRLLCPMKRAFIEPAAWRDGEVELSAGESHHILSVLRARAGDEIEVFDGRGRTARAALVAVRGKTAVIRVDPESVRSAEHHALSLTLFQAIPKHAGMESIIQKAVELGARTIVPVLTERVIVKLSPSAAKERLARWRKVALESAKQCKTDWLPEIMPVMPLEQAVKSVRSDLQIFGALAPHTPALKALLAAFHGAPPASITLVIGPEGDLTPQEQELLIGAGFKAASFGRLVLRVETAVAFGLSAVNYEFTPSAPRK